MSLLSRRAGRLCAALSLAAAIGCGAPTTKVNPGHFPGVTVQAQAVASEVAPAFADESGDALLVDASGAPFRVRLDGSLGPLESHPANPEAPGKIAGFHPLGPHLALAVAENGLFVSQNGWLISVPWSHALAPASVIGAADARDGSAWIATAGGLYRLKDGALSELKVGGRSVTGLKAVAAARAEDGSPGVWFAHDGGLSVIVAQGTGLVVRQATLPGASTMKIKSLAALGDSTTAPGELWVLTEDGQLYRDVVSGWRRFELGDKVSRIAAAGRVAWAVYTSNHAPETKLVRYDADADTWEGADAFAAGVRVSLLTADASGTAWVNAIAGDGSKTFQVSRDRAPRVVGMDQDMKVPEGELVVQAVLPPGAAPTQVAFALDDGTPIPVNGPLFSLGGDEADGRPRSYSFVGLSAGMHKLTATATYADGTSAARVVPYEFQPLSLVVPSWDKDIRPIHEARCAKCHTTGPGPDLSTYDLWKTNAPKIVDVLRERRMPADGPLEPELILEVQRWVQGGTPP